MKNILKIFIFTLTFSLLLFTNLYDSKALVYNGVDYQTLETGETYVIDDSEYYRVNVGAGNTLLGVYNYMATWPVESLIIQAPITAEFYLSDGVTLYTVGGENVTVVEFYIDTTNFAIKFYGLGGVLIDEQIIMNKISYNFLLPDNIDRLVTNIQGYSSIGGGGGYDETDLDNAYNDGKTDGLLEGYDEGWDEAIIDYIDNTLPALLAQANQEGYNDGKTDGLLEGYDDGLADGLLEGYDDGLADGILQGYDDGFADGLDDTTYVLGSLTYSQSTSTDYSVIFSLPTHQSSTSSLGDILSDVSGAFSGRDLAIYTVRQPKNITYEYELRNSNYDIIEIMPEFDMILFMGATDEMVILLNGNVIKYYNNARGIEYMTLRYTGFPNEDYQNGYLDGLNDGLLDGQTVGFMEGYNEARRELWTVRYELGYNEARDDYGYYDDVTGEWVNANARYMVGYYAGLEVNNSEAFNTGYNKGFREGSTDSFNAKLSDWIVPAIVIVLFLGGAIVIFNRRLGGRND